MICDHLVEYYLPSFLTCSLEVPWALINLFKVSPILEIRLSIIYNLLSVILFSWGVHWVRDTDDVRELLTLLIDALEILVKGGVEGNTTVNFPSSVSGITLGNVQQSTKQYFKTKLALAVLIILISTYLLFGEYSCILILLTTLVLGSVRSASCSSMKSWGYLDVPIQMRGSKPGSGLLRTSYLNIIFGITN